MIVIELDGAVFENENNLREITKVLNICSETDRYICFCDLSIVKDSVIYNKLLSIDQELIMESFNAVVTNSMRSSKTISEYSSDSKFDFNEANYFLNTPFIIFLENSLYDGYFLNALFNNFKRRSKKVSKHKDKGWLIFGNGGGFDNIKNVITDTLSRFEQLPKENHCYLRSIVVVDSDKTFPNDVKSNRTTLYDFLSKNNIEFHEMEKREIENYLPDQVLSTVKDNDQFISAYLRLNEIQKDFFNLQEGFPDKNITTLSKGIQDHYSTLSEEDFHIFRKNKLNLNGGFKSEFPKLFEHEQITQESLKDRTKGQRDPNELEKLIDKISNQL